MRHSGAKDNPLAAAHAANVVPQPLLLGFPAIDQRASHLKGLGTQSA